MAQTGPFNGCKVRQCSARSKRKQSMVEPVEESNPPHTHPQHGRQAAPLEEISYICGECGRSFAGHFSFAEHQKSHKEKIYKCVECRQTYTHETALLRHLQSHTVPEPFKCTECHQCFGKNSDLLQHQQIHQLVTPCHCTEAAAYEWRQSGEALEMSRGCERCLRTKSQQSALCAGSCSDPWHLDQHRETATALKHMPSPTGQQHLHTRAALEGHEKTPPGVDLHPCPHCRSSFRLKGSLALHMKIHRNQRIPD